MDRVVQTLLPLRVETGNLVSHLTGRSRQKPPSVPTGSGDHPRIAEAADPDQTRETDAWISVDVVSST